MKSLKELALKEASRVGPDGLLKCVGPTLCVARVFGAKLINGEAVPHCTCPMGAGCKHCRSVAITMVEHWKNNSRLTFTEEDIFKETLLYRKTKSELIDIIVRMKKKHPHLFKSSDVFNHYDEDDENEEDDDYDQDSSYHYRNTLLREDKIYIKKKINKIKIIFKLRFKCHLIKKFYLEILM
ncbi:hypothetical protein ACTFIU_005611 [Dictyostelium citrinum]